MSKKQFIEEWKETMDICHRCAKELGKDELAEQCQKLRDMPSAELMDKVEFLQTIQAAKKMLEDKIVLMRSELL